MIQVDDVSAETKDNLRSQLNSWLGEMIKAQVLPPAPPSGAQPMSGAVGDPSGAGADQTAGYELGEIFTEYVLGANLIHKHAQSGVDLSEIVRPTGRQHQQLKLNKQPVAYSRSRIPKGTSPRRKSKTVCQVQASSLAQAIGNAIQRIDEYEKTKSSYDDFPAVVRLLVVPAYNVYAFWIYCESLRESEALVISAPEWLSKLDRERPMSSSSFLQSFEGETPIEGLG